MRLLQYDNKGDFSLTGFFTGIIPPYAILSHTWGAEEVTLADLKTALARQVYLY